VRRPLFLAAAVLAATVLLAACGDDDTTTAGTDTAHMDGGVDMDSTTMGSMGHDGMGHGDNSAVADGARRIEVTATSFAFDPDEMTIEAGEDIAIVLTNDNTLLHDFTVDGLDAHVAADAGDTEEGGLRADEPGRYTFYCTVEGHRAAGMEGTLVVE
jgi:plastocyanin